LLVLTGICNNQVLDIYTKISLSGGPLGRMTSTAMYLLTSHFHNIKSSGHYSLTVCFIRPNINKLDNEISLVIWPKLPVNKNRSCYPVLFVTRFSCLPVIEYITGRFDCIRYSVFAPDNMIGQITSTTG
jgi:hypothetical protein